MLHYVLNLSFIDIPKNENILCTNVMFFYIRNLDIPGFWLSRSFLELLKNACLLYSMVCPFLLLIFFTFHPFKVFFFAWLSKPRFHRAQINIRKHSLSRMTRELAIVLLKAFLHQRQFLSTISKFALLVGPRICQQHVLQRWECPQRVVLCMTLNHNLWWVSNSKGLENVEKSLCYHHS